MLLLSQDQQTQHRFLCAAWHASSSCPCPPRSLVPGRFRSNPALPPRAPQRGASCTDRRATHGAGGRHGAAAGAQAHAEEGRMLVRGELLRGTAINTTPAPKNPQAGFREPGCKGGDQVVATPSTGRPSTGTGCPWGPRGPCTPAERLLHVSSKSRDPMHATAPEQRVCPIWPAGVHRQGVPLTRTTTWWGPASLPQSTLRPVTWVEHPYGMCASLHWAIPAAHDPSNYTNCTLPTCSMGLSATCMGGASRRLRRRFQARRSGQLMPRLRPVNSKSCMYGVWGCTGCERAGTLPPCSAGTNAQPCYCNVCIACDTPP